MFSLLVAAVLTETGARVWRAVKYRGQMQMVPHSRLGAAPPAGFVYERGGKRFALNEDGFRNAPLDPVKPPGALRIACVGGSCTLDTGTFSNADTWPMVMEREIRRRCGHVVIEVLNAGAPGYTTRQSVDNLRCRVAPFQPDIVLLYHGPNDVAQAAREDAVGRPRTPPSRAGRVHQWLDRRLLSYHLFHANVIGYAFAEDQLYLRELPPSYVARLRLSLDEMGRLCDELGATLVLAGVPAGFNVCEQGERHPYVMKALDFAQHYSYDGLKRAFLDFYDVYRGYALDHGLLFLAPGESMPADEGLFVDPWHTNARGSAWLGEYFAAALAPVVERLAIQRDQLAHHQDDMDAP